MPRPPPRRIRNGRQRRMPIRVTSLRFRHMALNGTQQAILSRVHYQIGNLQLLSKKLITTVALLQVLSRFHPPATEYTIFIQRIFLVLLKFFSRVLRHLWRTDSFIGDIPQEEEEEARQRQAVQDHPLTFDSFEEADLRRMTRFTRSSLVILKAFFNLPEIIQLHPSTLRHRLPHESHFGCHHIQSEELILFSLYRFAHGLSITVLTEKFGGNIDKWMYGFKYFVHHIHPLVYPGLVGFNGIAKYVNHFHTFAARIEKVCNESRRRFDADGNAIVYPGVAFPPNTFNVIGFFDCRYQKTLKPGTGPVDDFRGAPRHPDAQVIQQAVYSGYKKLHGVKSLTVQLANGLSFIFTPISARR